jgi:hypothetical protein
MRATPRSWGSAPQARAVLILRVVVMMMAMRGVCVHPSRLSQSHPDPLTLQSCQSCTHSWGEIKLLGVLNSAAAERPQRIERVERSGAEMIGRRDFHRCECNLRTCTLDHSPPLSPTSSSPLLDPAPRATSCCGPAARPAPLCRCLGRATLQRLRKTRLPTHTAAPCSASSLLWCHVISKPLLIASSVTTRYDAVTRLLQRKLPGARPRMIRRSSGRQRELARIIRLRQIVRDVGVRGVQMPTRPLVDAKRLS